MITSKRAVFVAALLAGSALLFIGRAQATIPAIVQSALTPLTEFTTFHIALNAGSAYVLRMDASADGPNITLDSHDGSSRLHWNGLQAFVRSGDQTPVTLPAEVADDIEDFWIEMRSGFPNTTFTPRHPNDVLAPESEWPDGSWERSRGLSHKYMSRPVYPDRPNTLWYQVDLPFAWDDAYAIFMAFSANGELFGPIAVMHEQTGMPLRVNSWPASGRLWFRYVAFSMRSDTTFVDVPLHPDVGQPTPARIHQIIPESDRNNEFRHLPYHEQRWHAPLDYDHANSTGSSHVGEPRKGVQYQRQACLGPDDIYQHSVSLIWNMPSSQVSHTTLALAECPDVRLDLTQFTRFQPAADAEVCVNGTWQMLDTNSSPPSTLWSTTVSDCVSGPSESGRQSWALPVPPPSRIPHLQVRFDGSAHIDCSSAHPEVSSVGLLVHGMDGPRFSWEGCWPGWAP